MSKHGEAINKLTVQRDQLQSALSEISEQRDRLLEALKLVKQTACPSNCMFVWPSYADTQRLLWEIDAAIASIERQPATVESEGEDK